MSPFLAGDKATIAAKFKHHNSVRHLWEDEWKVACQRGAYPFNEGTHFPDFEPIFQTLIEKEINDPFDDRWPEEFVPRICNLISQADSKRKNEPDEASKLFLRASSLCHIARFPVLNSTLRRIIWSMQKEAYTAATSFWKDPVKLIHVPHKHATAEDGSSIPLSYRFPSRKAGSGPVPVMLCISGLDGFRIDFPARCTNFFNSQGWAIVGAEIPGCGDCPAARMDPESPDRLWSSVLDWIVEQPELDEHNVCAWGFSTGGYYSLRAAHTHANRLKGVIAQGLYAHYAFSAEWIDVMDSGEYPSLLTQSLMNKYDYSSVEEMKADSQKRFSLVENGILNKPCCKILMLNGMDDTIYPIEDSMLVLQYGGPKEARFTPGRGHMGEPQAGPIGFAWIQKLFETPQYQLEEAFRLYQEALKLHSQQALALKDIKNQRRESRNNRKVSGIVTKPYGITGIDNGPPSGDSSFHSDKEHASPTAREFRLPRKVSPSEANAPVAGSTRPLASSTPDMSRPVSNVSEAVTVIRGPPATHGAVVLDRASAPSSHERPHSQNPATPPLTPGSSQKASSETGTDADAEDMGTEMTGNEDRRMSTVSTMSADTSTLNFVLSSDSYTPSTSATTTTSRLNLAPNSNRNSRGELNKKDSFEDMYGYMPSGIETEVIHPQSSATGLPLANVPNTHDNNGHNVTVQVNGQLTPESPRLREKRLSAMFDRSARPVSVYRSENERWAPASHAHHRGAGMNLRRAETMAGGELR